MGHDWEGQRLESRGSGLEGQDGEGTHLESGGPSLEGKDCWGGIQKFLLNRLVE